MLRKVKFVGIVTIRINMETRNNSDYSGDRLTLGDIGVSKDDLQAELQAMKDELGPDNVVQMSDYRPTEPIVKSGKPRSTHERNKKIKAVVLAGATLLGSAKITYEMFRDKIHPVERIESAEELEAAKPVDIEDIKPGSELEVSPFSYTVTGGNVRTSPQVEFNDENLVQHTDLTGKIITHPIEVTDESNSTNGNWYVFYDGDGQKFAINEQNLDVIADPNIIETNDITVTVDKTTNMGIIAHDANNISMQVATVVEASS